jgi:hypothetical protein
MACTSSLQEGKRGRVSCVCTVCGSAPPVTRGRPAAWGLGFQLAAFFPKLGFGTKFAEIDLVNQFASLTVVALVLKAGPFRLSSPRSLPYH